jgi:hypothetical protein
MPLVESKINALILEERFWSNKSFISLIPKLFFHLVTWQYFFYQKYKKDNSNHIYLVTHFILCSAQMVSKIHLQNQ